MVGDQRTARRAVLVGAPDINWRLITLAVDYRAFIRRTGVPAVISYAGAIGIKLPAVDDGSDPGAVLSALERAAGDEQRIWSVFQEAEALSPREARWVLRSVLVRHPSLLAAFDAKTETNRECALWLASNSYELFEKAVSVLNTSRRLGGQSWDGWLVTTTDAVEVHPELSGEAIAAFERHVRDALEAARTSGPRGKIKAVPFERLLAAKVTHSQRTVTQITIYAEGPHESREKISEANEVHFVSERSIDKGAVIYDPSHRTIEVVVQGGARVREAVADAFCKSFFPKGVQLFRLISREIDFSRFLREPVLPLIASDPIEHVAVDEIRYSLPDSGGALITLESPYSAARKTSIYAEARDWPEVSHPENMSSWTIVAVRLRFLFKGDGKSRKKRVRTVELKAPRSTNLREKSDSDHAIMHELLERWGIFKVDPHATRNDH